MTATGKLTITRGQTVYEFEAVGPVMGSVCFDLAVAEQWVFDSPTRLSALDEAEKFRVAQPGDTVQVRTR